MSPLLPSLVIVGEPTVISRLRIRTKPPPHIVITVKRPRTTSEVSSYELADTLASSSASITVVLGVEPVPRIEPA